MKRKLSRSGNGWAIFLPKVIVELLKINPEKEEVELRVEGETLIIKKAEIKQEE